MIGAEWVPVALVAAFVAWTSAVVAYMHVAASVREERLKDEIAELQATVKRERGMREQAGRAARTYIARMGSSGAPLDDEHARMLLDLTAAADGAALAVEGPAGNDGAGAPVDSNGEHASPA